MKKVLFLFYIIFSLTACSKKDAPATREFSSANPIRVVATIGMIGDVAGNIGGDRVEVYTMMGPGVDPHLYKAKARDLERLSKADLILYNGLHLESKLGEILEQLSDKRPVAAVSENIPVEDLIEVAPGAYDPHVWFDVSKWRQAAENIYKVYEELDPAGADEYRERYEAYDLKLKELHKYVQERARELVAEKRILITAHDAFNYFGQAYGFQVLGLQGISTVDEAGTKDIRALANFIAEKEVSAIFVETSVSSKSILALQGAVIDRGFTVEVGGELFSDAMGSTGTPEGTYMGMVKHNIDTIVSGLSK